MADQVAGAFVGFAVSEVLDKLIDGLKVLGSKDENLQKLECLFQRLQPFVSELKSFVKYQNTHPARTWLEHLDKQLEEARELVSTSGDESIGLVLRSRISKKLVRVNVNISKLVQEASLAHWASGLSTTATLLEVLGDQAETLTEIKRVQERIQQSVLELAHAVTLQPASFREGEIKRIAFRRSGVFDDGSSSSVDPIQAPNSEPEISFGGKAVSELIIRNLISGERYKKWVGLWAMGGAGKTFTAKIVFSDSRVRKHFSGGKFWITVSKDQPPTLHLLKELYRQIVGLDDLSQFPDDLAEAKTMVRGLIENVAKVLLVLDDVWEAEIIDSLDVISQEKRGVILVTTRDDQTMRGIADAVEIIKIPPLSEEQSWQLFSWHAFGSRGKDVPSYLEGIAKDVTSECKGLPLALVVIGASMSDIRIFDREKRRGKSLRDEWEKALKHLRSASVYGDEYDALYLRLQLSVDNLRKEDYRLKDCFFYFAAFPEDHEVPIEDLVDIWIAEGMVKADADSFVSPREEANFLLGLLLAKSMVELTADGMSCKVHDVMRDLARRNLKKNFDTNQRIDESKRQCLYASGVGMSTFPTEWTTPNTRFSVEKLSLFRNDLGELPGQFNAPRLRVLILAENQRLQVLPSAFFRLLSNLRVMILACTDIEIISDAVIVGLKSLVLLNLNSCARLKKISPRINDLDNLETVRLEDCDMLEELQSLPRNVLSLTGKFGDQVFQWRSLKILELTYSGCNLPDMSSLASLDSLSLVCSNLTSLPPSILKLRYLRKLESLSCPKLISLPALDELPRLESLSLRNFGKHSMLPESFGCSGAFRSIKGIAFSHVQLTALCTFFPGCMQHLQSLLLQRCRGLKALPKSLTVLDSLVELVLSDISVDNLECIFLESNCFPNLETLVVSNVDFPGRLPKSIALLPNLSLLKCRKVLVRTCPRRFDCQGEGCPEDDCPRNFIPEEILALERQGKLKIARKSRDEVRLRM